MNKFKYILDSALEFKSGICDVCIKDKDKIYPYFGILESENGEEDVYNVCETCMKSKDLHHITDFEAIDSIKEYFESIDLDENSKNTRINSIIDCYQISPGLPRFNQYFDQPLCCNDLTVFIGNPTDMDDLLHVSKHYTYWYQERMKDNSYADFEECGEPESMRDVAKFECSHCKTKYYTFQPT